MKNKYLFEQILQRIEVLEKRFSERMTVDAQVLPLMTMNFAKIDQKEAREFAWDIAKTPSAVGPIYEVLMSRSGTGSISLPSLKSLMNLENWKKSLINCKGKRSVSDITNDMTLEEYIRRGREKYLKTGDESLVKKEEEAQMIKNTQNILSSNVPKETRVMRALNKIRKYGDEWQMDDIVYYLENRADNLPRKASSNEED